MRPENKPRECGSRRRPGNRDRLRPIPARPPPARHAGARSPPDRAAPAGCARCRRPPAQPSRPRPHRTQGTRPRRRRRSKSTRKNMRHPPSSTPSPKLPSGPAPVQSGHQPPRYNLPGTQRVPPGPNVIPPRHTSRAGHAVKVTVMNPPVGPAHTSRYGRRPGRAQSHQCDATSPRRTPGWLVSAKQPRMVPLPAAGQLPWRPALCPAGGNHAPCDIRACLAAGH